MARLSIDSRPLRSRPGGVSPPAPPLPQPRSEVAPHLALQCEKRFSFGEVPAQLCATRRVRFVQSLELQHKKALGFDAGFTRGVQPMLDTADGDHLRLQ